MKQLLFRSFFFVAVLVGVALVARPSTADAAQTANTGVKLTVEPLDNVVVGENPVLTAHLTTSAGTPIAGASLSLFVNDEYAQQASTGEGGIALLKIRRDFPAGDYRIRVAFNGDPHAGMQPAAASRTLTIHPGSIEVQSVPKLPGVQFRASWALDELVPWRDPATITVTADSNGVAHIPVQRDGLYRIEVLPWHGNDPGRRAEFSRWQDNIYKASRLVSYQPGLVLQAGFDTSILVSQDFTDLNKQPIDQHLISSIVIKSSMGGLLTYPDGSPRWVPAARVVKRREGLEVTKLYYSIDSVIVDDSNVVNRSQNRFFPSDTRKWTIPLLFYSAHFSASDALFGFPIGRAIELTAANGSVKEIPLDKNGTAVIPLLPRGSFSVRVLGGGYSPPAPVALSKNQQVDLVVISYLDAGFVAGLGVVVALGLLLIGRRSLVFFPFRVVWQGWRFVTGGRLRRVESES
ncbi:MAG TPA: hypothetical protein VFL82_13950 [Thermomicrobiales bacterium]|jgi:hypothetical protein|nr:hypothetical protein [Thermomicrobiales bacterium]